MLGVACGASAEPAWVVTTLWIEPVDAATVRGLATQQYASGRWERRQRDRDHLCAELFAFTGEPADLCEGCEASWALSFESLESHCPWAPRADLLPQAIGLGPVFEELVGAPPVPGAGAGSWTRHADQAWAPHGFAFRGPLSAPDTDLPAWNQRDPITAWPAWAVALDPTQGGLERAR